jgi:hypothetical protein
MKQMKINLPAACLFGLVGIGIVIIRIGIRQKKNGDVMIGALIAVGSLLVYFLEFF